MRELSLVHRKEASTVKRWLDRRGAVAGGLPLLLYLLTLSPSIYNLDSAELTTAAYTGGIMRSTGYPLYLAIGYFWSRLPIGDVGYRMNLLSAVFAALTILLADRVLRRLQVNGWAAFAALGLLATSPFFWGLSLVAEVYTLHTALMAGLILALLRWGESPTPRRLAAVTLMAGLGLSHHAAMILLLPGCLFYLLCAHPSRLKEPRSLLAALAGGLLGLSFHLYLPIRYLAQPAFNYAGLYDAGLNFHPVDLTTVQGHAWLVSGRAFANALLAYRGWELWNEARGFLVLLGQSFIAIGIGPGILGSGLLFRRDWRTAGMLVLMFVLNVGFYINYRVVDKDTMYLPAYLIWALWLGYGCQGAFRWLGQIDSAAARRFSQAALQFLCAGAVLFALVWNWRIVDLSQDWSTRQRGEAILARLEPDALVFGWWDTAPVLQYLQLVEGRRPDIQVVNRFLIAPEDLAEAAAREILNRPVYIDSLAGELPAAILGEPAGPVVRLVPAASRGGAARNRPGSAQAR